MASTLLSAGMDIVGKVGHRSADVPGCTQQNVMVVQSLALLACTLLQNGGDAAMSATEAANQHCVIMRLWALLLQSGQTPRCMVTAWGHHVLSGAFREGSPSA